MTSKTARLTRRSHWLAVALAALTVGSTHIVARIPHTDVDRFIAMAYNVTGSAPSVGSVSAFLVNGIQANDFTA